MNGNVIATHDRSHADYQHQWDTLVPQGYRPICISVYGDRSHPLYAAIWVKRSGPAFAGIHGATGQQFQQFFDTWAAQGFSPTILAATGPSNNPVYAAVMEKSNHGVSLTRHHLVSGSDKDSATVQYWLAEARRQNWIPRWISVFGEPNNRRYALVLDPNPDHVRWSADGVEGETAEAYQGRFNAQQSQWAWPSLVAVAPDGRFVSVFRDGEIAPWVARHNMTSAGYQAEVNTWWPKGYFPLYVQAGGSGAGARFACFFVQGEKPASRRLTVTGPTASAFQSVDKKVETYMKDTATRAVGVAVTRQGRLVHARAFTWAENGYPTTQPTSMFRIASCTKPLTSMAIHRLIQDGQLSLTDRMQDILNLQTAPGKTITPNIRNITVHHLLTHSGGWDRAKIYDLPNLDDVARAFGQKGLPVSLEQMARYKLSEPLQFTPGTAHSALHR